MTLIAFAAGKHTAAIITDTGAYTRGTRHVTTHRHKAVTLPGIDAAVVTQGSSGFGDLWQGLARVLADQSAGFDEFEDHASGAIPALWAELQEQVAQQNAADGAQGRLANSIAFHVGYSARAGRFVAHQYASDDGFTRRDLTGLHVQPSPLRTRPSNVELQRLEEHFRVNFDDASPVRPLRSLPRPKVPRTPEQWAKLARTVRRDRALAPVYSGFKTIVCGDVILTRLAVGSVTQGVVHTFDDDGDEFATMVASTLHPIAQEGPCECGSRRRFVDCCLDEIAAQTCPCGSGKPFAQCCSVLAGVGAVAGLTSI